MSVPNEPRVVTPQEAQHAEMPGAEVALIRWDDLVRTVATEPERTRAAVVEALRGLATGLDRPLTLREAFTRTVPLIGAGDLERYAEAIENGADW